MACILIGGYAPYFYGFFAPTGEAFILRLKDAPTHLLPRCVRREDAREVCAEDLRRLLVLRLHIVERFDEEKIGELFDDDKGVRHAVGKHIGPDLVDVGFEFSGNQWRSPILSPDMPLHT